MKKYLTAIIPLVMLILLFTECSRSMATSNIEQTTPNILFGFDLYNPEGWSAYDDWEQWESWMNDEELLISLSDYNIGEFSFGMTIDDAVQYFPSEPQSENDENYDFLIKRALTFDSLVLIFVSIDSDPFSLYSIEVTGSEYITPRGLRVGDDAMKLFELYGVPLSVSNNVWTYGDGFYENLFVTVDNGAVQKIFLCSTL